MEPVGELDDKEELEHEGHVDVGVSLPEGADVEQLFPEDDVPGPDDGDQVEGEELPALVELGVLHLGEVQLAVHLVQNVLLKLGGNDALSHVWKQINLDKKLFVN